MPFIPERHRIISQYVQDTRLREAFQWRETWKCFSLTIIIVAFVLGVLRDPSNIGLSQNNWLEYVYCLLGCLFLYVFYIIECRYSEIVWDLAATDMVPISIVSEYIVQLKRAEPHVWWQASCYHFAEPKSPRQDPNKVTKITMHISRVSFDHRNFGYTDISNDLVFGQRSPLVKIEFRKGFAFARPRHAEEFESARNEFFSANEPVDDHMEKKEGFDLTDVEFEKYIYAGRFPRFVNTTTYWMCSLVLLSWPYRVYVNYNTSYANYTITKLFGHVRMIPSYSEAMLMDPAPPAYDCPSPLDARDTATSRAMTIFRTCSPNYVPANLVRYVESGPSVYPPTYEEALRCPLFELAAAHRDDGTVAGRDDDGDDHNARATVRGSSSAVVTFETSL